MGDTMITRGLGRGYQPVKDRGNDGNISKPPSFRGQSVEELKIGRCSFTLETKNKV